MEKYDPHEAINYIYTNSDAYALAKGHLAELEVWKSSLKAIKMAESNEQTVTAQEREAYRSEDYQNLSKAIGEATRQVEALRWKLEAAKMRFQAWQTESANNRQIERLTV
jgi:chromosome segregation ATPase